MSRRKHQEEHENHERWLVSYADFITLLFAFFVVMYSVSSINEGKYRVLSDVLVAAFRSPAQSMEPIQFGRVGRSQSMSPPDGRLKQPKLIPDLRPLPAVNTRRIRRPVLLDRMALATKPGQISVAEVKPKPGKLDTPTESRRPDPLDTIVQRLQASIPELINADLVRVRRGATVVEVEIGDAILFSSGSAVINESALSPLKAIAEVLKEVPNPLQVEGFTDNRPIRTPVYPSNWELSAARAASVVHVLMESGVRPERMAAIGYGEHRPIADNASEEGRNRNRRVVLVIQGDDEARGHDDKAVPAKPESAPVQANLAKVP